MSGVLAAFLLAGCAGDKFPAAVDNDPIFLGVPQALSAYGQVVGKAVQAPEEARNDKTILTIKKTRQLSQSAIRKLLEQDLREQAGLIILHQDSGHVEFGFAPDKKSGQ